MVTEDVCEKGYKFLDLETELTEKNKNILKCCKNINEFRFWCFILLAGNIDPICMYYNCCFKNNKAFVISVRYNCSIKSPYEIFDKHSNYVDFFKNSFIEINENFISDKYKNTQHYKFYIDSINNFTDFTNEERQNINEKLIDLLILFTKLIEKGKTNKYLKSVLDRIYYFFEDYFKKCMYNRKDIKGICSYDDINEILENIRLNIKNDHYRLLNTFFNCISRNIKNSIL